MGKKWEVKISVDDVMNCPFFKFINMSLNWEMKYVFVSVRMELNDHNIYLIH